MSKTYIDYPFKLEPRAHQIATWRRAKGRTFYAYFLDMGTGKTKVDIDDFSWAYDQGSIDGVLIIAPKGVYSNWLGVYRDGAWMNGEIPKHIAEHVRWRGAIYDAGAKVAQRRQLEDFMKVKGDDLRVLCVNVESLSAKEGPAVELCEQFLLSTRCHMTIDESTCIKHESAQRTKTVIKLGRLARMRRILCGNPYANGPLDIFAPCKFLSDEALGYDSYWAFKAEFAKLVRRQTMFTDHAGREKRRTYFQVVGYQNLDKLKTIVESFSSTVKKSECLDLPPKIMMPPRVVEMTAKQARVYKDMARRSMAEIDAQMDLPLRRDDEPELDFEQLMKVEDVNPAPEDAPRPQIRMAVAEIVLTKMLRLQQIACGFVKTDDGEDVDLCDGKNPRVQGMLDAVAEVRGKTIIWSPFVRCTTEIIAALEQEYGAGCCVRIDGHPSATKIEDAREWFQDPASPVRFWVGSEKKGARGNTLTAAEFMLYYANDYDNELREQSEDRAHRDGLTHSVAYQDLVAAPVDHRVLEVLKGKKSIAEMLRDGSWRDLFQV